MGGEDFAAFLRARARRVPRDRLAQRGARPRPRTSSPEVRRRRGRAPHRRRSPASPHGGSSRHDDSTRHAARRLRAGRRPARRRPRAEWMQPDPTYREAQKALRDAARDTAGHGDDAARLATLGAAQLRLQCKLADAEKTLTRVLALQPGNATAPRGSASSPRTADATRRAGVAARARRRLRGRRARPLRDGDPPRGLEGRDRAAPEARGRERTAAAARGARRSARRPRWSTAKARRS